MNPADFPAPVEGFVLTHFLVVSDQDRSREFYRSLLDGQVVLERDPVILKVANSWLILNEGGGPTDDKPTVTLTTPPEPNRTSSFLNIRVADIATVYKEWSAKGGRVPHRAQGPRRGDPRLHPRPRWPPDRGGPGAALTRDMSKPMLEFHKPFGPWEAIEGPVDGVWTQMLAEDPDTGDYTRLLRFDAGVDTSPLGIRTHDYWEEVYLLEGDLTDLRLDQTFGAGMYACRPPGMPHGPWRTYHGALMLEMRHGGSAQRKDVE